MPPADLIARAKFSSHSRRYAHGVKSLIIPCHTDKRTLITICADVWRRNGDFMNIKIAVIGGDIRQITVARLLKDDGYDVFLYGFDEKSVPEGLMLSDSLNTVCKNADIVVLGLPACTDSGYISCKERNIASDELVEQLNSDCHVIGGKMCSNLTEKLRKRNIKFYDYFQREELAVENAIPTAEGAIAIAMSELPITVNGSNCLVAGYGRIGKILADFLRGLGAKVTCSARKPSDLAWISACGHRAVNTADLSESLKAFDIIFNTIPYRIFDKKSLLKVNENVLIIDLASKPGGVDFEAARALGVNVIWALSLPGKVAPVSAGKIIKNTITNIIKEELT